MTNLTAMDPSSSEYVIELVGVGKSYDDVMAVHQVDLDIEPGEFLVLLGPSGCGKSTLLKMIAGLEDPTEGEIYIDGRLANYLPPKERDVAMVFQNYALYPHMTVETNIGFPLKMRKVPAPEIGRRVAEVAALLELTGQLKRYPEQLSGGQRQRVALGRAIIRDPVAFLMDEPLSNLDALLRVQMRTELLRLHRKVGRTTVYVTHDQVEAMTMASRIVVMRDGVIQQVGKPADIYAQPANTFVATFVGSPPMNLIDGTFEPGGSGGVFHGPAELRVAGLAGASMPNGRATLGFRPEDVAVVGPAEGDLVGTVDLVEEIGSDAFLSIDVGLAASLIVRVPANGPLTEGARLGLSLNRMAICLFDELGVRVPYEVARPS